MAKLLSMKKRSVNMKKLGQLLPALSNCDL